MTSDGLVSRQRARSEAEGLCGRKSQSQGLVAQAPWWFKKVPLPLWASLLSGEKG